MKCLSNASPATSRRSLFAVAIATSLVAFTGPIAIAQNEIVVGATVPITGPASLSGKQYHNSLKLAEADINKAGGINGKKVKFYFEDARGDNGTALNAFIKLWQERKPAFVFVSSYSPQNAAVAPEILKAKIPVMYAGGSDALAQLNNPYMFRIRPQDSIAAVAMAQFAKNTLKASKPGIVYVQNDFGQGAANAAAKQFAEAGVTVVGNEAYGSTDKDMSAQLLNLKNRGTDVILAFVYPSDGALLLRQIKQLSLKQAVVASSGAFLPGSMQLLSASDLQNVWGVVDSVLDANPTANMFVANYRSRFGTTADPYAAAYYDGAMIMAQAMRAVGTDPEKLRGYLSTVKGYQGVGAALEFDSKRNGVHEVSVVNFKKGTKEMNFVTKIKTAVF